MKRVISVLRSGEDSILDVGERQLDLDHRPVDPMEPGSAVLDHLCQRPGSAVERSALLRDAWGHGARVGATRPAVRTCHPGYHSVP
jgi:DNA-binding winged helix-turn-helix (wHTH) protein